MLKQGATILSLWFLFNVVPAVLSLVSLLQGAHAPLFHFVYTQRELRSLDPRVFAIGDGIVILASGVIISFCLQSFFVVRRNLMNREKWAFYVLLLNVVVIQIACYWSDRVLGGKSFWWVNISSVVFAVGLGLSTVGLWRPGASGKAGPSSH